MARAVLHDDREFERDYLLSNGNIVTLVLEDDYSQITFKNIDGESLSGEFLFFENEDTGNFLLGRMYAPIKKQGIGRACLEFFTEMTDSTVYTRPDDGIVRDDGSHLTEDAPGFVGKMQEEGLLQEESDDYLFEDE